MTFSTVAMEVSKSTASGKRELIGTVSIFVPTLSDAGITGAVQAVVDGKPEVDSNGLPVYADDVHNFVQQAIYTQVKAQARNRLKPQSLELKSSLGIATDWAMLTAENIGAGNPEALIALREVKALFATWVAGLGKSAKAQTLITTLFNSKDALKAQDATSKGKISTYVLEFADTLTSEQATKYAKPLENIIEACAADTEADDF